MPNFYVYVRLGADLDLTDVLYPHNLFLQIDVDMDASTGYLVREVWVGARHRFQRLVCIHQFWPCRPSQLL